MKTDIVEYRTSSVYEGIPKHVLQANKKRLNAFYMERECIENKGDKFIFRYVFYSLEKLKRLTKNSLSKQYESLSPTLKAVEPDKIQSMENKYVMLYGDISSPETKELVDTYLKKHNVQEACPPFYDKINQARNKTDIAYEELQKVLFYCKKKKCPLLFVSVNMLIRDIRFFNLLEESNIDFRCIDFPWFCNENLKLIKAVMLYEQL